MLEIHSVNELKAYSFEARQIIAKIKSENRSPTAEEVARVEEIQHAINTFSVGMGQEREPGPAVGPNANTSADGLKPAISMKDLTEDRLVLRDDASGRLLVAKEPHERFSQAESLPDTTILTDIVNGRPNAALQQSNSFAMGGVLLDDVTGGFMIDLARNANVCTRLGARALPFPDYAESMKLITVTQDPTASWRGEGQKVDSSEGKFGAINVSPKYISCLVPMTLELFETARNSEQMLRNMIAQSLGLGLDLAALRGSAAAANPTGILNSQGVNIIDYSTLGSITNPYAPISRAVRRILDANYPGEVSSLGMAQSPILLESWDTLVDTTGQPLRPSQWFADLRKVSSNQIPTNVGTGGNKTEVYVGAFDQLCFFIKQGIFIELLREGIIQNVASNAVEHNLTQEFKVALRAIMRVDVAILRPSWFSVLTNHPLEV